MKVALLLTGNELMTGDTVDSNSSRIAQSLALQGFDVAHKVTVGDDLALIVRELKNLTHRYEIVIVNGGLGPTVDDLTAEALSILSGQALVENNQALAHVNAWCEARGIAANAANLKQSLLPATAVVLDNPIGSAVGIQLVFNESLIFSWKQLIFSAKILNYKESSVLLNTAFRVIIKNCKEEKKPQLNINNFIGMTAQDYKTSVI